ncbi:hypothetical protein FRAAL3392 [Frankia alni ACN14a]|uniref:Uncharacterized protein n=1 Tax=Frankia alni (strain DSM 45986 / CECT 9034 / ACN14a) TaxID=326424 RepID=Q0RKC2_FRAAA|nr:hypothetical protein FRAAL3392 [Frankia alni ACN14a]
MSHPGGVVGTLPPGAPPAGRGPPGGLRRDARARLTRGTGAVTWQIDHPAGIGVQSGPDQAAGGAARPCGDVEKAARGRE